MNHEGAKDTKKKNKREKNNIKNIIVKIIAYELMI